MTDEAVAQTEERGKFRPCFSPEIQVRSLSASTK
jgi:hypothetical protein